MNKAKTIPGFDMASPAVSQTSNTPKNIDWIEEMVGSLTDPIIVFPAQGWMDALPQPLKDRLPMERLAYLHLCMVGKADIEEAPDIEAVLYMFPRTMEAPMPSEWIRIYLYLGTKVMGKACPDDIKQNELSDWELGLLRDFKRWLRDRKVKARQERHKQAGTSEKPATKIMPEKYTQAKMF